MPYTPTPIPDLLPPEAPEPESGEGFFSAAARYLFLGAVIFGGIRFYDSVTGGHIGKGWKWWKERKGRKLAAKQAWIEADEAKLQARRKTLEAKAATWGLDASARATKKDTDGSGTKSGSYDMFKECYDAADRAAGPKGQQRGPIPKAWKKAYIKCGREKDVAIPMAGTSLFGRMEKKYKG